MSPINPALNWISISHLQHFVARGQAVGLNMGDWLEDAGLSSAALDDADRTVPIAVLENLLASVASRHQLPLLGLHLASDIQPATLGPLGHIAQACNNFGEVLEMAQRFHGVLSNIGELQIERQPGQVALCWDAKAGSETFQRQAREYVLGTVFVIARFLLPEQKNQVLRVNFRHSRPDDAGHARGYFSFFRCPVHFDQPHNSLVMPSELLRVRMHHGDAFVKDLLEQHAQRVLTDRQCQHSLEDEVRHLIRAMMMESLPTKDMVAMQLGISGRHLHRRLQDNGTNYRDLLHAVRLEVAKDFLGDSKTTVVSIAPRLGFSSRQAFLRWFRQSTSLSPTEYRASIHDSNR